MTKSENRIPNQTTMTNDEWPRLRPLVIAVSSLIRHSVFGFRHSAVTLLALVAAILSGCSSKPTEMVESRPAFGTKFTIDVIGPTERSTNRVIAAGWAELDLCASKLDPTKPDSDIAQINAQAGGEPVEVDPLTATCLAAAREACQTTGVPAGLDKVQIGGASPLPKGAKTTKPTAAAPLNSVRLPEAGMRIDLGDFVLGHTIDRMAQRMKQAGAVAGEVSVEGGPTVTFGVWPPEAQRSTAPEAKPAKP
jgi:hypothetical protein